MASSSSDDDDGYDSDEPTASAGYCKLVVWLHPKTSGCNVCYFHCPFACTLRFPAVGLKTMTVRDHVRMHHIDFMGYACHAVDSPTSASVDHVRHPDLLGTCMTDSMLQRYKESARRMTRDMPGQHEHIFSYLDVVRPRNNVHLYVCSYCDFSSGRLEDYKRHASIRHVELAIMPPLPHGSVFPVMGSPVR